MPDPFRKEALDSLLPARPNIFAPRPDTEPSFNPFAIPPESGAGVNIFAIPPTAPGAFNIFAPRPAPAPGLRPDPMAAFVEQHPTAPAFAAPEFADSPLPLAMPDFLAEEVGPLPPLAKDYADIMRRTVQPPAPPPSLVDLPPLTSPAQAVTAVKALAEMVLPQFVRDAEAVTDKEEAAAMRQVREMRATAAPTRDAALWKKSQRMLEQVETRRQRKLFGTPGRTWDEQPTGEDEERFINRRGEVTPIVKPPQRTYREAVPGLLDPYVAGLVLGNDRKAVDMAPAARLLIGISSGAKPRAVDLDTLANGQPLSREKSFYLMRLAGVVANHEWKPFSTAQRDDDQNNFFALLEDPAVTTYLRTADAGAQDPAVAAAAAAAAIDQLLTEQEAAAGTRTGVRSPGVEALRPSWENPLAAEIRIRKMGAGGETTSLDNLTRSAYAAGDDYSAALAQAESKRLELDRGFDWGKALGNVWPDAGRTVSGLVTAFFAGPIVIATEAAFQTARALDPENNLYYRQQQDPAATFMVNAHEALLEGVGSMVREDLPLLASLAVPGWELDAETSYRVKRRFEQSPMTAVLDVTMLAGPLVRSISALAGLRYSRALGVVGGLSKGYGEVPKLGKVLGAAGRTLWEAPASFLKSQMERQLAKGGAGKAAAPAADVSPAALKAESAAMRSAVAAVKHDAQVLRALEFWEVNLNRISQLRVAEDALTSAVESLAHGTGMTGLVNNLALGIRKFQQGIEAKAVKYFARPGELEQAAIGAMVQGLPVQSNFAARRLMDSFEGAAKRLEVKYGIARDEAAALVITGAQGVADIGAARAMRLEQPLAQYGQIILDDAAAKGLKQVQIGKVKVSLEALESYAAGNKMPLTQAKIEQLRADKVLPPPRAARAEHLTHEEYLATGETNSLKWSLAVKAALEDGHYARALAAGRLGADRVREIVTGAGLAMPKELAGVLLDKTAVVGALVYDAIAEARKAMTPDLYAAATIERMAADLGLNPGVATWRYLRDRVVTGRAWTGKPGGLPVITGFTPEAVAEAVALDAAVTSLGFEGGGLADTFAAVYDRVGKSRLGKLLTGFAKSAYAMEVMERLTPKMFRVEAHLDRMIPVGTTAGKVVQVSVRKILDEIEAPVVDLSTAMYEAGIEAVKAGLLKPEALLTHSLAYLHRDVGTGFKDILSQWGEKWFGAGPAALADFPGAAPAEVMAARMAMLREVQTAPVVKVEKKGLNPAVVEGLPAAMAGLLTEIDPLLLRRKYLAKHPFRLAPQGTETADAMTASIGRRMYQAIYDTSAATFYEAIHRQTTLTGFAKTLQALRTEAATATETITELFRGTALSEASRTFIKSRLALDLAATPVDHMSRLALIRKIVHETEALLYDSLPPAVATIVRELGFKSVETTVGAIAGLKAAVADFAPIHVTPRLETTLWGFARQNFEIQRSGLDKVVREVTSIFKKNLVGLRAGPPFRDAIGFRYVVAPTFGLEAWSNAWRMHYDIALGNNSLSNMMAVYGLKSTAPETGGAGKMVASGSLVKDSLAWLREWDKGLADGVAHVRGAALSESPGTRVPAAIALEMGGMAKSTIRFMGLPSRSMTGKALLAQRGVIDEAGRAALVSKLLAEAAVKAAANAPETMATLRALMVALGMGPKAVLAGEDILAGIHAAARQAGKKGSWKLPPKEPVAPAALVAAPPPGLKGRVSAALQKERRVDLGVVSRIDAKQAARNGVYTQAFDALFGVVGREETARIMAFAKKATVDYSDKSRWLAALTEYPVLPFATYFVKTLPHMVEWMGKHPAQAMANLQLYRSITQGLWAMLGGEGSWADVEDQVPYWLKGPMIPAFAAVAWRNPILGQVEAPGAISGRFLTPFGGGFMENVSLFTNPVVETVRTGMQLLGGDTPQAGYPIQTDPRAALGIRAGGPMMTEAEGSGPQKALQWGASLLGQWGAANQLAIAPTTSGPLMLRGGPEMLTLLETQTGTTRTGGLARPTGLAFLRAAGINAMPAGDQANLMQAAVGTLRAEKGRVESQEQGRNSRSYDMFDGMNDALVDLGGGPLREAESQLDEYTGKRRQKVNLALRPDLAGGTSATAAAGIKRMREYQELVRDRMDSLGDALRMRLLATASGLLLEGEFHQFPVLLNNLAGEGIEEAGKRLKADLTLIRGGQEPEGLDYVFAPVQRALGMAIDSTVETDAEGVSRVLPGKWPDEPPRLTHTPRKASERHGYKQAKEDFRKKRATEPERSLLQGLGKKERAAIEAALDEE